MPALAPPVDPEHTADLGAGRQPMRGNPKLS
jgi:hypothetical protein